MLSLFSHLFLLHLSLRLSPTAEDPVTRELVAATLCNVSVDEHARVLMISMGVVDVLATLSGTTSGLIQVRFRQCKIRIVICIEDIHE